MISIHLALLLAGGEQTEHLSDARTADLWASRTLDPAEIALAIEGRQRFKEGSRFRRAFEGGKHICCERIRLRPLWCQHHLDLRACLHAVISSPHRAKRQEMLASIRAERATHAAAVDGTGDVVALLHAPDRIGIEGDRDVGSAACFGNNRLEALHCHALHLIDERIEYATGYSQG